MKRKLICFSILFTCLFAGFILFGCEKADARIGSDTSDINLQDNISEPETKEVNVNFCLQSNIIKYVDLGLNEDKIPLKLDQIQAQDGYVYTYTNSSPEIFEFDEKTFKITPLKSGIGKLKLEVTKNSQICGNTEVSVVVNEIVKSLNVELTNFEVKESLENAIIFNGVLVLEDYSEGMERFLNFYSDEIFIDEENIFFCNKGQCIYIPFSITSTDTIEKIYHLEYENIFNNFYSKVVFEGEIEIKVEVTGIIFKANDEVCENVELYYYNLSPENRELAISDGYYDEVKICAFAENYLASSDFDFTMENDNIAVIKNGKIIAKSVGETKLIILAKDGSEYKKEIEIIIKEIPITSIKFDTNKLPKIVYVKNDQEGCFLKIDIQSLVILPSYLENLQLCFAGENEEYADFFEISCTGENKIKLYEKDILFDEITIEIKVVNFSIERLGIGNECYKLQLSKGFNCSDFIVYGKTETGYELIEEYIISDYNIFNIPVNLGFSEFKFCFVGNEKIFVCVEFNI